LNVIGFGLTAWVFYSVWKISPTTNGSASSFSVRGLARVIALYVTLWWSFHPPCPRPAPQTIGSTRGSSRPSNPSGHSAHSRPSKNGGNVYAPCTSSSGIDTLADAALPAEGTPEGVPADCAISIEPASSSASGVPADDEISSGYSTADSDPASSSSSSSAVEIPETAIEIARQV